MVGDILQPTHLLFVLIIALLVLGPKRLPEVGRALGNGIRDFKSAIDGQSDDRHDEIGGDNGGHEFAHDAYTSTEDHEFAHEEPAATDHEFAGSEPHDEQPAAATESETPGPGSGEKHEFAYEGSEPVAKPAEPQS